MSAPREDDGSSAPGTARDDDAMFDMGTVLRRIALFVGVAVVVVLLVATLPGIGEVRDRLRSAQPGWIAVAAGCSVASVLGFVAALIGAFDRVVPVRRGLVLGLAEQGANVLLPAGGAGGPAFGTFVMRRAGAPPEVAAERHAALFLITSAVGLVALVLFGALEAVNVLPGSPSLLGTLLPAGGGALVLLAAVLFSHGAPPAEPDQDRRLPHTFWRLRTFLRDGLRISLALLRLGDPLLIGGSIAYYAFDVAALGATFEAFGGGGPPLGVFVLAYTLGHAGAFVPTPGGVGGTDGGLIGAFALYGAPLDLATAAVLSYRVFQLGLPAILGVVSLLQIRRVFAGDTDQDAVAARFSALDRHLA